MTDEQILAVLDKAGLVAGTHWRLAKVDGKTEIVISQAGLQMLADWHASNGGAA